MATTTSGTMHSPPVATTRAAPAQHRTVDVLRIGLGFIFLWPFLDKLFGLGYSTPGSKAWIHGGSPTNGFLGHVQVGPFQSIFRSFAGASWADWLFMIALLGVGVAFLAGVMLRIAGVAGALLLVLMWAAEWPMARFTSAGDPTSSTNPLIDYHLIYAAALLVVAAVGIASSWGLGKWWAARPLVEKYPVLL